MSSSLLSAIIGISIIVSGNSHHGFLMKMNGDYQENNRVRGFEMHTTIKDQNPLFKLINLDTTGTKSSFYIKDFVNSNNTPSLSIGSNITWGEYNNPRGWRFKWGYTYGLVKGYTPPIIYQDDCNEIKASIAPYALGWVNFSVKLYPKKDVRAGLDVNCAPAACGWQFGINYNWGKNK